MFFRSIVIALAFALASETAYAVELEVPPSASGGAYLTVYTNDFALTRDQRTVRNAKPRAVTVPVVEQLPGSREITRETASHKKLNAAEVEWALQVPAMGRVVLEYNVRTRF